jgi:hypothetical protein
MYNDYEKYIKFSVIIYRTGMRATLSWEKCS